MVLLHTPESSRRPQMLPACRTEGDDFAIPTFDVVRSDVEGFMDDLWEFQSAFHDCFSRNEPRAQFFDYLVGQLSPLERKSIEPMALHVEGGTIRGLQRFISDVRWDEGQMLWNYPRSSWVATRRGLHKPVSSSPPFKTVRTTFMVYGLAPAVPLRDPRSVPSHFASSTGVHP